MSDAELVVEIAAGDHEAFEEVCLRHRHELVVRATQRCGSLHADDLAQEVLVGLWRAPERFDPARGSVCAYLLLKVGGRAVDQLRGDTARKRRETTTGRRQRRHPESVESLVLARWAQREVARALGALPPRERRAIELAYFVGYSYQEVAVVLDRPEGTVKSWIRTGMLRLRHLLAADLAGSFTDL